MATRPVHIIATERHTLCGVFVSDRIGPQEPWTNWLTTYQRDPAAVCPECKRLANRSADRWKAIREADRILAAGADVDPETK